MNNETKQWVGDYIPDDAPIYACGLWENGHQCAQRLRIYTGPKPPQWQYMVAYCPVHGVVPVWTTLEDAKEVQEAAIGRVKA